LADSGLPPIAKDCHISIFDCIFVSGVLSQIGAFQNSRCLFFATGYQTNFISPLDVGQFCPISRGRRQDVERRTRAPGISRRRSESNHEAMSDSRGGLTPMSPKRDRFIAQVKQLAAKKGPKFQQQIWRGKGGHAMI
jgi:hypothetical protein